MNLFCILYGANKLYSDVTDIALKMCTITSDNILIIPTTDKEKESIFGNQLSRGIVKHILVILNGETIIYENGTEIRIPLPIK